MAKNDARSQIPEPVMTPPVSSVTVTGLPKESYPNLKDLEREAMAGAEIRRVVDAAHVHVHGAICYDLGCVSGLTPLRPGAPNPQASAAPAVTELAARAITNGASMAREYAAAAGELCRTADTHAQARSNARRLLRLALAHLEA